MVAGVGGVVFFLACAVGFFWQCALRVCPSFSFASLYQVHSALAVQAALSSPLHGDGVVDFFGSGVVVVVAAGVVVDLSGVVVALASGVVVVAAGGVVVVGLVSLAAAAATEPHTAVMLSTTAHAAAIRILFATRIAQIPWTRGRQTNTEQRGNLALFWVLDRGFEPVIAHNSSRSR